MNKLLLFQTRQFSQFSSVQKNFASLPTLSSRLAKQYNIPYLLIPIKQVLFPHNTYLTKLHPLHLAYLAETDSKYVVVSTLKEDSKSEAIDVEVQIPENSEFVTKRIQEENAIKPESKELMDQTAMSHIHQNIIYDESINQKISQKESFPITKLSSLDDVYNIGTICKISLTSISKLSDDLYMSLKGVNRVHISKEYQDEKFHPQITEFLKSVMVEPLKEIDDTTSPNYPTKLTMLIELYANLRNRIPINVPELLFWPADPKILDVLSGFLSLSAFFKRPDLQKLLELPSPMQRLNLLFEYFSKYEKAIVSQWQVLERTTAGAKDPEEQKKQMEELYKYLKSARTSPFKAPLLERILKQMENRNFPPHVQKLIKEELSNMEDLHEQHPDFNNKRTLLELLISLPFGLLTPDRFNLDEAKKILDEDHFGMDEVKERILEFIAITKLRGTVKGKSLLLVGPPGVGKTSIASSIAKCLNRKFIRISLGGEYDVAVVKGHRKTYLGSYPGKIVQALKNVQSENPVILLDEVDKIGRSLRGNIQDALLEVLDPMQNDKFYDNYLEVPIDLSKVLFICSANLLETIHPALLDRMEVIQLSGYTQNEKKNILEKHLLPKTLQAVGLDKDYKGKISFSDESIASLIDGYARESGVRGLERCIRRICEKIGLKIITKKITEITLQPSNLTEFLGLPPFSSKRMYEGPPLPGIMIGLAYNSYGGSILFIETLKRNYDEEIPSQEHDRINTIESIEALKEGKSVPTQTPKRKGVLKLTGSLGEVMQESVQIAYTYARHFCSNFLKNYYLEQNDVHIHFPEGASKKDGPSAGIAITSSLISLAMDKGMENEFAMTGEISLTGKVLKIGGLKEKLLAAKREGVNKVIFPSENKGDVDELKDYIKEGMEIYFVEKYLDVVKLLFPSIIEEIEKEKAI